MIEDKLRRLHMETGIDFTLEGFKKHWEMTVDNPGWTYNKQLEQLIISNLLLLNKAIELKEEASNPDKQRLYQLQHSNYQSARAIMELEEELSRVKAELQELKNSKPVPEKDLLFPLLSLWITSHPGHEVTARELYNDLKAISQDKGLSFDIPDSRQLGVKLKAVWKELEEIYCCNFINKTGNVRYYSFSEKTGEKDNE